MSDELNAKEYYRELPKFKHQYSKEFKHFIVNQLGPLNIQNTGLKMTTLYIKITASKF